MCSQQSATILLEGRQTRGQFSSLSSHAYAGGYSLLSGDKSGDLLCDIEISTSSGADRSRHSGPGS